MLVTICIEGDNFDKTWRESLVQTGLDHGANSDVDEEDEPENVLKQAWQQLKTPGQHFRVKLMNNLFDSPFSAVEHRP